MKIQKKSLCVILVLAIVILSMCSNSVFALTESEDKLLTKCDKALIEEMEKLGDDEKVPVSIWFNGLNEEVSNNEIVKALNEQLGYKLAGYDILNMQIEKNQLELSIDESQEVLKIIRRKNLDLNCEYLNDTLDKLINYAKISEDDILYKSSYLPNIEVVLTYSQIEKLANNKEVELMYSLEKISFVDSEEVMRSNSNDVTNTDLYEYTGISSLKANASGSGIKIGMIDWGVVDSTKACFSTAIANNRLHIVGSINSISSHMTLTAAQIIGKYGNFEGIAPNCDMYCIATGNPNTTQITWKDKIETLIDCGVNIINASFSALGDGRNNYGDSAKWLDAMVNTQNVLFVQSAATDEPPEDNIISGGMAYNTIVVGAYDMNTNTVYYNSAYNTGNGTYKQYKPDLIAPCDMVVQYENNSIGYCGGTSCASPVVSGALVLLLSNHSDLLLYSCLTKALLLNGTKYLGTDNVMDSTNVFVAFARDSGAGILDIAQTNLCYATQHMYGATLNYNNYVDLSFYVSTSLKPVRVTVCANKNNILQSNGQYVNTNYVPNYSIKVTGGGHEWYSICTFDNKCAVSFTPPKKGYYTVRITSLNVSTFIYAVYTSC